MSWHLYYDDGKVFTNKDGTPDESPKFGLVAIAQELNGEIMPLAGDYFAFHGPIGSVSARWFNHDLVGLLDYLVKDAENISAVRIGRYVDDADYKKILQNIINLAHGRS